MNKLLSVYKPVGLTPLQVIHAVRKLKPELADEKIGYAGRLDPLAHGVLLLMIGEATKSRETYLNLSKEYEFEVLFGVATDSFDVMGLIKKENENVGFVKEKVNAFVNEHVGKILQKYPPYSSKAVQGKPLFWWAKQNRLAEITIPEHEVFVEKFELLSINEMTSDALFKLINARVGMVSGDFRQEEILECWDRYFVHQQFLPERSRRPGKSEPFDSSASWRIRSGKNYVTAKFRISCSSGTYVRGLVDELGKYLGTGALALEIKRTRVGSYKLEDSLLLTNIQ